MNLKRAFLLIGLVAFSVWLGLEAEWRRWPTMFVLFVVVVPAAVVAGVMVWWTRQRKGRPAEAKEEGSE